MSKFLFSLLILAYCFNSSFATFTDEECLNAEFSAKVSHPAQPFGWTDTIFQIDKQGCVITIFHQKLKWIEKKWVIDVCRGPVHIKIGAGAVDVLKRKGVCREEDTDGVEFCVAFDYLIQTIQDDGLIFAAGEKENINTDHGRVYCSYLLISTYLGKGTIYSRHVHKSGLQEAAASIKNVPVFTPSHTPGTSRQKNITNIQTTSPAPSNFPTTNQAPAVAPTESLEAGKAEDL